MIKIWAPVLYTWKQGEKQQSLCKDGSASFGEGRMEPHKIRKVSYNSCNHS